MVYRPYYQMEECIGIRISGLENTKKENISKIKCVKQDLPAGETNIAGGLIAM